MLISFSLENWRSFRDRVTFSMVAGRERRHVERVPRIKEFNTRILPIAAVYGGNASGKSNFVDALIFAQNMVVRGLMPNAAIPIEPFRIDADAAQRPSSFAFQLLIGDAAYEFSFSVTRSNVVEEKLVDISATREKLLYHRKDGKIELHPSLKESSFLKFAFRGTRDNQLFLTNAVFQKVEDFLPIYKWFDDTLQIIAPDAKGSQIYNFFDEKHPLYISMGNILRQLDTGISRLGIKEIPFEDPKLRAELKNMLLSLKIEMKDGASVRLNKEYIVTRKDGDFTIQTLVAYHGDDVPFRISDESDGSQRLIDLLPALIGISAKDSKKVYVIDEFDRSLHTLLTQRLIEAYFVSCSADSRSQLLFTTHDVLLINQYLLRRDEIWCVERDATENSALISFNDYKDIRFDKDIRKSYLQGRFGGVPSLFLVDAFGHDYYEE